MLNKDGVYAMYLRKSRADLEAEQRGQFETLAHHLQILTDLAKKHGIRIVKTYREIVSGDSIEGRPEVQKLLSEVQQGIYDGVLVTEISRLARGRTKDQGTVAEAFRSSGTLIITPSKIYDPTDDADETFFDFELFMARQEYKYIKKRMQRGRQLSRQNGNWIFPHVPIGYKKEGLRLIPDRDAPILKAAMLDFAHGKRTETETILHLRSVLPSRKWGYEATRRTLGNPIYCGYLRDRKIDPNADNLNTDEYTPANCIPIISLQDHVDIVRRFTPRPRLKKGKPLKNAFAGLIRCSTCGRAILYHDNHGKPVLSHQRGIDTPDCRCSQIYYSKAYQEITAAIIENLPDQSLTQEPQDHSEELSALQRQLKKAEQIRTALFDKLEEGLYTPSEFKERKILRDNEINALKRQIEGLEGQKKAVPPISVSTDDLKKVLSSGTAAEVNELLRILIDHIEYSKPSRKAEPIYRIFFR